MLKNKWVLIYIAVTGLVGYTQMGVLGAFSLPLLGPGSLLNQAVSHGRRDDGLIIGSSVIFWIALHLWLKHRRRPAVPTANAPTFEVVRQSVETWED
jgi:hypothetical protein